MTISKPTVAKTTAAPNDVKEHEYVVAEPALQPTRPTPSDNNPPPSGSKGSWLVGLIMTTVLVGGSIGGWIYRDTWWPRVAPLIGLETKPPTKPSKPDVPVVTAVVQQKDMQVFINGLGTVTAFKTVTIRSRVEGELVNVAFNEGQMVKEGELIAEIDRRPFDVQLQQAEGQLARDEATLKTAEFTFKRYQELQQSKSIAPQQVDEQRSLVQQTIGGIQSDRAAVANAKLQLDYCHIIAPITGRIGLRLVDQGNIVRANDPNGLAVITQLQPISLVFTIPQDDISRVQKSFSEQQELVVQAYDRNLKTKLATGKLLAIDNQVDATTGTVRLKAVFDNEDNLLFPNQFVNARLLVDKKTNAVVVPTAAIQRGPASFFVYVVQADDTVELRDVKPGIAEGSETAINSGLSPGEVVVTDGLDKLSKGAKVRTGKDSDKDDAGKKGSEKKSDQSNKKHEGDKPADKASPHKNASDKPESVTPKPDLAEKASRSKPVVESESTTEKKSSP